MDEFGVMTPSEARAAISYLLEQHRLAAKELEKTQSILDDFLDEEKVLGWSPELSINILSMEVRNLRTKVKMSGFRLSILRIRVEQAVGSPAPDAASDRLVKDLESLRHDLVGRDFVVTH